MDIINYKIMDKTPLKQLKPEHYSLILHIKHYEHQKPIQQIL